MEIEAINGPERIALFCDGSVAPIDCFLDSNGDECCFAESVVAIVGPHGVDKKWSAVDLSEYKSVSIQ